MTLGQKHSLSGSWAPLLFHEEVVTFYMVTFCNLVIWWQRPRLGLSLSWTGDGNGCCGTTPEYPNILGRGDLVRGRIYPIGKW